MSTRKGVASTSAGGKAQKGGWNGIGAEHLGSKCPINLLSEQEFRASFHIPNSVSILLVNNEPLTSEKQSHNATYFSKKQLNAGLYFSIPYFLKKFLHFTKIPLAFLHPNVIRVLMGCNILDMLYQLDLSLPEVLFVYIVKMSRK